MTLHKGTERLKGLMPFFLMAVVIAFIYSPLLDAWFLGDDPQWMWFSAVNPLWKIFFDSSTYLYINDANFTPMLGLSFKMDWSLFKMNPVGYNVHSLLSLFASSVMLYIFLRLFTGRVVAFSASLLFILNPATVAVISCFSNRHYMEGMFWALLSLYMFVRFKKEGETSFLIISGLAYILASLSKEVYLLLPAFVFMLTDGNFAQRFKKTLPLWMLLLVYLLWRWFMLGRRMGGYYFIDWSFKGMLSNIMMAMTLPIRYVYGDYRNIFLIAFVLISIMIIAKRRGLKMWVTASGMYLVSLLPIIPVMAIFILSGPSGGRYALQITTFLIIIFTAAYFLMNAKTLKILITILFLFSLFVFYGQATKIRDAFILDRETSREEALKFVENSKYLRGVYPIWFYDGLKRLYNSFYRKHIGTRVFYEDSLKYNPPDLIREVKGENASTYLEAQKKFEKGPLSIDIRWDGRIVKWRLGPENVRFFNLLIRKENEFYYLYPPVRNSGRHIFAKDFADNENIFFRIFYRFPEGQEVVSPEIKLFIPGKGHFQYRSGEEKNNV
jgi:hypothetical protein